MRTIHVLFLYAVFLCVVVSFVVSPRTHAADNLYFPQTGHTISGRFLSYWQNNGGLPVFGYPITDAADGS